MIVRMLAGVSGPGARCFSRSSTTARRPSRNWSSYDPHLVVGILGGSSGTTRDAFQMLHDAQKYGAKVALYGRKINQAENQLAFIQFLRLIVEGVIGPVEAVQAYHAVLELLGVAPHRSLDDDLKLTTGRLDELRRVVAPRRASSNPDPRSRPPRTQTSILDPPVQARSPTSILSDPTAATRDLTTRRMGTVFPSAPMARLTSEGWARRKTGLSPRPSGPWKLDHRGRQGRLAG